MNIKILILTTLTAVIGAFWLSSKGNNNISIDQTATASVKAGPFQVIPSEVVINQSNESDTQDSTYKTATLELEDNLTSEPVFNPNLNRIQDEVASLSNLNNPEEIFKAQESLVKLKTKHGDSVELAILDALFSGEIDAQTGIETIEIVGIESASHKSALLDWLIQLTDDSDKLILVDLFHEINFDDNQKMLVTGIIETWQQSSDEELRSSIAAVAIDVGVIDQGILANALQDQSTQVRYNALSSLQSSRKNWSKLTPMIRALSDDELQPSEIRRIAAQLL